jgi:vacuolar-type H+-ATPase subunit I/STV1
LKTEIELVRPQLKYLKTLGFNIVRLLVMWKAIEPMPNPDLNKLMSEGKHYLEMVKEIVDALYVQGLFVIIDFHQDIAHEVSYYLRMSLQLSHIPHYTTLQKFAARITGTILYKIISSFILLLNYTA